MLSHCMRRSPAMSYWNMHKIIRRGFEHRGAPKIAHGARPGVGAHPKGPEGAPKDLRRRSLRKIAAAIMSSMPLWLQSASPTEAKEAEETGPIWPLPPGRRTLSVPGVCICGAGTVPALVGFSRNEEKTGLALLRRRRTTSLTQGFSLGWTNHQKTVPRRGTTVLASTLLSLRFRSWGEEEHG